MSLVNIVHPLTLNSCYSFSLVLFYGQMSCLINAPEHLQKRKMYLLDPNVYSKATTTTTTINWHTIYLLHAQVHFAIYIPKAVTSISTIFLQNKFDLELTDSG